MSEPYKPWTIVKKYYDHGPWFYLSKEGFHYRQAPSYITHAIERRQWYADNLMWFDTKVEAQFVVNDLEHDLDYIIEPIQLGDMRLYFNRQPHERR